MTSNIQSNLVLASVGVVITMALLWQPVSSHGRLINPPARSTMWRYGFDTPTYYQDNELFCGGFQHQVRLGYKCGICGDPWDGPRPHEAGGVYATGTLADTYVQGQEIVIEVELTANHKGWFEFKLCPTNNYLVKATQECLDLYPLDLSDGSGTKLGVSNLGNSVISIPVRLPPALTCQFCVLQWHYHAGNNWGTDPDGTSCVGCGYQEEFYGCADVAILPDGGTQSPAVTTPSDATGTPGTITTTSNPTNTQTPASSQTNLPPTTNDMTANPTTTIEGATPTVIGVQTTTSTTSISGGPYILSCWAVVFIPGLKEWCDTNCNLNYCPASHCACDSVPDPRASEEANLPPGCYATTPFLNWPGIDDWCWNNCIGGVCPDSRCFCTSY